MCAVDMISECINNMHADKSKSKHNFIIVLLFSAAAVMIPARGAAEMNVNDILAYE